MRKLTEETKMKIKQSCINNAKWIGATGSEHPKSKKCICVYNGEEIIKDSFVELYTYLEKEYGITNARMWRSKKRVPKRYTQISFYGTLEEYMNR